MISGKEEKIHIFDTQEKLHLEELSGPKDISRHRISNVKVLMLTGFLFGCFMIAEMIAALESNSLALLGDAFATLVDVGTCCSNLFAESTKSKSNSELNSRKSLLEIYIPAFSATCLLGVTLWITISAVRIILEGGTDYSVDLTILWTLSTINLVIDLCSALLFYCQGKEILQSPNKIYYIDQEIVEEDQSLLYHTNLNMLSTLTHVSGDLMRTISVLAAATLSSLFNLNTSLCDAWASIVVSITIVMIVCPLFRELINASFERGNYHQEFNLHR